MRIRLIAVLMAAGLCLGAVSVTLAQPDDDAKKAMEKALAEAAAKAGLTGQPATPPIPAAPPSRPVPSDLPVIKTITLDEGLVAEELKIGDGYEVKAGGVVVAEYHGTLKDGGKKFDSSYDRPEPAMFPLAQVIPGWQKGVPGMKVGGIRRLIIPSKLAYGDRKVGEDIPPNSDLVFIIQLVDALQVIEEKVGEGEEIGNQAVTITATTFKDAEGKVLKDAEGKELAYPKEKPYIWIPNEMPMGVSIGMEGMKVGGKRTFKVPAKMNQSNPQLSGTRPQNVPITVEVEALGVRNLLPPGASRR